MPEREGQDRSAECTDVTKLLPFYLNRSLEEEELRRVEAHLAVCAACRQEERDTRAARDLYEGHLPVELLLDYALAQPMPAQSLAVVESHLAVCPRCSEEVATVRQKPTASGQGARGATVAAPTFRKPTERGLRNLAWAACFATVVASAGWIWTWRQLTDERARSSMLTARANLPVVELLPTTETFPQRNSNDPRASANRVELPDDADEIVLVLLSGGRGCESGCLLEIHDAAKAQPKWQVEGLVPSPDGHVTLALPRAWLPPERSVLAVRDEASGELVAEYLLEIQHS